MQLVDDYVRTLDINVPNITAIRRHRKNMEKELSVTKDYLRALSMSSEVHLTRAQWRQAITLLPTPYSRLPTPYSLLPGRA
jgi:hypothetical protein